METVKKLVQWIVDLETLNQRLAVENEQTTKACASLRQKLADVTKELDSLRPTSE